MDRRKFLALSGTASVGFAAGLAPSIAHSATSQTSLNAADLGLKPNASGNQSAALQKAVNQAAQQKLPLFIPAGSYVVSDISLLPNVHIYGMNGQSILLQQGDAPLLNSQNTDNLIIENISFEGNQIGTQNSALVSLNQTKNLIITQCQFFMGNGNGLNLYGCNGQIIANQFHDIGQTAIFSNDGDKLKIMRNEIHDIGNNGILVWQNEKSDDSSIVSHNHIYKIHARDGGSGQNGNGINIFKANQVIVSDNRIDDCYYSAVRINDGNGCQVINNNCTNIGEVALYAEFAFNGVIINNNIVDLAGAGISITNLNDGGHLAVCKGNLLRNLTIKPLPTQLDDPRNYGISAEGDALIEGNVIENATNYGIGGGYGEFQRNVNVVNNMVKDCGYGITASVAQNAGRMSISNNSINNARNGNIIGFEWDNPATSDLINDNQNFEQGSHNNLNISNNVVI